MARNLSHEGAQSGAPLNPHYTFHFYLLVNHYWLGIGEGCQPLREAQSLGLWHLDLVIDPWCPPLNFVLHDLAWLDGRVLLCLELFRSSVRGLVWTDARHGAHLARRCWWGPRFTTIGEVKSKQLCKTFGSVIKLFWWIWFFPITFIHYITFYV